MSGDIGARPGHGQARHSNQTVGWPSGHPDRQRDDRPDVQEMVLIHRYFRREFGLLPLLVTAVVPGDTARAGVVGVHARELLATLHVHHTGEDELLWPRLRERVQPRAELVATMEAQHRELAGAIGAVAELMLEWERFADPTAGALLAQHAVQLLTALTEHLDHEEREILPLAAEYLSVQEWAQLGEHGIAHTPRNRLLRQLGQILEDASEDERRRFLRRLPLPPRLLWPTVGWPQYRRYVRRIRQPLPGRGTTR